MLSSARFRSRGRLPVLSYLHRDNQVTALYLHTSIYTAATRSHCPSCSCHRLNKKGKASQYSIAEHWVLELIPVLGSQPAGDVSHKPGGRLPLLSARPAVTLTTLMRAAIPVSLLGEYRRDGCEQFA